MRQCGALFMHYNFGRVHQTLRVTPAMEAGISDNVWSAEEIVALVDRSRGSRADPSVMSDPILTQAEADTLIAMEKHRVDEREWSFPAKGEKTSSRSSRPTSVSTLS